MIAPLAILLTYLLSGQLQVAVPGNTTEVTTPSATTAETELLPATEMILVVDETTPSTLKSFDVATSEPPHRAKRSDDLFTSSISKALAGIIKMNMRPESPIPRGPSILKRIGRSD